MAESKKYRFVAYVSGEHRQDRIQVADNKFLEYDPDRSKPPVSLTESQHAAVVPYAVLEAVEDQPLPYDVNGASYQDLQEFAKENNVPGRANKSEDELRTLVRDFLVKKNEEA